MARSEMRVTADSIEDHKGHRLVDEINKHLVAAEEYVQRFMNENPNEIPNNPIEIVAKIKLTADGVCLRKLQFEVSRKEPQVSSSHSMGLRSQDGVLMMDAPGRQAGFDFQRVADAAAVAAEEEDATAPAQEEGE